MRRLTPSGNPKRKFIHMTNVPVKSDGFDDAAAGRVIQGEIIKFVDGEWKTKEGEPVPVDLPLLALATTRVLQKWVAKMPTETLLERPGEPLPDVDELNAAIPESTWEVGMNGKRPPWTLSAVVYFLRPGDASAFTFISSTAGGRVATERLAERVSRMRLLRGAKVLPLITLGSAPMKTRYGVKDRPEFVISDWKDFGAPAQALPPPGTPTPPSIGAPVAPVSVREELNDSIGF
jgi:hypothetical protein